MMPPPGSWMPLGRCSSCRLSRLALSECWLVTADPPLLAADSPFTATRLSRLEPPIVPDRNRPLACDTGVGAADAEGAIATATPAAVSVASTAALLRTVRARGTGDCRLSEDDGRRTAILFLPRQ